jgi:hypothetical protein
VGCRVLAACAALVVVGSSLALAQSARDVRWVVTLRRSSGGELNGVACTSRRVCIAVGGSGSPQVQRPLVERWKGPGWSVVPAPISIHSADLTAVSCPSQELCVAAGNDAGGPFVATLRRRSWSVHRLGVDRSDRLGGVSCASKAFCMLVGGGLHGSVAVRWNGSRSSLVRTPKVDGGEFNGVSCVSSRACAAVGDWDDGALAEWWNGKTWVKRVGHGNNESDDYSLAGVSCVSIRACVAVGGAETDVDFGIAEFWNGRRWSRRDPGPRNVYGFIGPLSGVSCSAVNACTAVGSEDPSAADWNGARWSVRRTGLRSSITFTGVSCASVTRCTAVGSLTRSSGSLPIAAVGH